MCEGPQYKSILSGIFRGRDKKAAYLRRFWGVCEKHLKKIFWDFRRWELNPQTRKKLVATASRREGVYNRTGGPSVTFCEKEEQWSGWLIFYEIKSRNELHSFRRGGGEGSRTPVRRPSWQTFYRLSSWFVFPLRRSSTAGCRLVVLKGFALHSRPHASEFPI